MPGSSSGKDLGVFDFIDDETVKRTAECALSRFAARAAANPNPSSRLDGRIDGIDKYTFLQTFAPSADQGHKGTETFGVDLPCVEIYESDEEQHEAPMEVDREAERETPIEKASEGAPLLKDDNEEVGDRESEREDLMEEEANEDAPESSPSPPMTGDKVTKNCVQEECLTERSFTAASLIPFVADEKDNEVASERSNDEDETERVLDSDGSLRCSSTSLSSSYSNAEDEGCMDLLGTNDCSAGMEEMNMDTEVNISVEYFTCGDNCYGESQLTFLTDSIKATCKDGNDDNCLSEFKWSIANLLLINCQWSQSVETAWIEVRMKPTSIDECGGSLECSGTSRLTFAVLGSWWVRKEQMIMSLAPAYKNAWRTEPDSSATTSSDGHMEPVPLFSRQYISDAEVIFEDIIYPKGDPDAVCISRRDVELLKPETFINDTIIDFYIKYLKDKIKPEDRDKYHFFNSFFFRKLADLDKDRGCTLEGRAAFLRVRKWTRKIDIFEKDYIFIPVNFNLHWSLVVICHPGEVYGFEDKILNEQHRIPCILHMDSIKGSHHGLKNHMQSYLLEEWKERHPDCPDKSYEKFLNLRFVSLELPQQENSFDCGLFLLHYVELFLKEAPTYFNPFKISESSHFLNLNWFIPAEASCKRFVLRDLLYKLYRGEDINGSSSSTNITLQSSIVSSNNLEKETTTHEPQSCLSVPDIDDPAKHAISRMDRHMRTPFVSTLGNRDGELVSCQLLEPSTRRISSNTVDFQQIGLSEHSLNVIQEVSEPFECFDAEKDQTQCVNLETTEMCSLSLLIDPGAVLSQNQVTANVVESEDDQSMTRTHVLMDFSTCSTAVLVNSNGIHSQTEDLNCVGILGTAGKPEFDSPRHLQQESSGDDSSSLFGKVPIGTSFIEDPHANSVTDSVGCLNQEATQLNLVSHENDKESEKPCTPVEREVVDYSVVVEDSENEETDTPTGCGEPLRNSDDPYTLLHSTVAPDGNGSPSLNNGESGKVDEELPEEQRPAKFQKTSRGETGRRRPRKPVK